MPDRCKQELCPNWSGDGNVCPCALFDIEPPAVDPCNFCPHDTTEHAEDGCRDCGCVVPA